MIPFRRPVATLILTAAGLALLSACGSSSVAPTATPAKSASQLLSDSANALKTATSVRMKADLNSSSQHITIDAKLKPGGSFDGDVSTNGTPFHLVVVNGTSYISGRQLWQKTGGDAAAALFGDTCVSTSGSNPGAGQIATGIAQLSNFSGLADSLSSQSSGVTQGGNTTVNGKNGIVLQTSAGTLIVAADGTPYPLEVNSTGGSSGSSGKIDFTDFNSDMNITAPTNCVDYSQLTGGAPAASTPTP